MNVPAQPAAWPLRVLIVDDHGGCRGLIREVLEGCTSINDVGVPTFVECASGEAALASLATTTPDLVAPEPAAPITANPTLTG